MQLPKRKVINKLTPDIFVKAFHQALILEYENKFFDKLDECRKCKSKNIVRLDKVSNTICKLITEDGFKDVKLSIKRYRCKTCGHVSNSESPFYPNCGYAKPIVDICLFLAAKNPYNRVENIMLNYGLHP